MMFRPTRILLEGVGPRRGLLPPRSSYYNADYRQGAALMRARRPYVIKNAITGVVLTGIVISIYLYTLRAVSQDEFEDVVVPATPRTTREDGSK